MSDSRIGEDIEALCGFEGRLAGTDAERRACNHVASRLRAQGREAAVEPTYVQPQWAVVHLIHCTVAAVGSMLAAVEPALGFTLVLLAAASAYLDLNGRFYVLRRIPFRRASQNVVSPSPAGGARMARLVLCANADAPRTGVAYTGLLNRIGDAAGRRLPLVASPTRIWFWSIALLLPPLGARMAGIDAAWLSFLQLPQTLVLIVAVFLLGEIALSPASPGANANASGVAALLEAVRRLDSDPPSSLRIDALVCGAGETTMEGMRAYLRRHRREIDRKATWFVSLESVGRGHPRWAVSQGPAISLPMDPELTEICEALAAGGPEGPAPEPMRDGRTSAAFVARANGYRSLAITCRESGRALPEHHHTPGDTVDRVDPEAVAAASGLAVDVARVLDRDLSRRSGGTRPVTAEPALA